MPKSGKTHKGMAKRYKKTGSGKKIVAMYQGKGHLMSTKPGKRVRQLRRPRVIEASDALGKKIIDLIP